VRISEEAGKVEETKDLYKRLEREREREIRAARQERESSAHSRVQLQDLKLLVYEALSY
jgi:hypothetical protein